jgi:hypothetical protein
MSVIHNPEHDPDYNPHGPRDPWDKDGKPKRYGPWGKNRKHHKRKLTREQAMIYFVLVVIMILAADFDNFGRKVLGGHDCPPGYVATGDRACTPEDLNAKTTYAGY